MTKSSLTAEAIYHTLGRQLAEMPPFAHERAETPDDRKWIGRTIAILQETGFIFEAGDFKRGADDIVSRIRVSDGVRIMRIALETAVGKAELRAPSTSSGTFIPVGATYDAFGAVAKVLSESVTEILIIDPYADHSILEFATTAPETVRMRILSDEFSAKPSLKPASDRWPQQFPNTRPLEVRLSPARRLHDRLIIVDAKTAWVVGQSFSHLAQRTHSSIVRADPEISALKVMAYDDIWNQSAPI